MPSDLYFSKTNGIAYLCAEGTNDIVGERMICDANVVNRQRLMDSRI